MGNTNTQKTTKSSEATFEELYSKQDYKSAINSLLHNKQQFDSGTFHYNLGTTYAKLGDIGAARLHLELAIQKGMYNTETINNLRYVVSKFDGEDITTSSSLIDSSLNFTLNIPKEAYLSMSLFFVLCVLLWIKLKNISNKIVWALCLFVSLIPLIYGFGYLQTINTAISLKEIPVYEGPSKIFQEKGKLKPGAKIVLGELKDGWYFVKYPITLSGWVQRDSLGLY